jgi:outer membrane protein TolC
MQIRDLSMKILLIDSQKLAFTFLLGSLMWAEPVLSLTLKETLIESLKNSNDLASSRESWVVARESVFSSTSSEEISLKYTGSGSLSESDSGSGFKSSDSYSNKITLSKNIYDGGQSKESLSLARINLQRATASYNDTEQKVLLKAVQSYLDVIKSRQEAELQIKNLERLSRHVTAAKVRLREGTDTPTSLAEAQARYARAQADSIIANTSVENAEDLFFKLTLVRPNSHMKNDILLDLNQVLPASQGLAESLAIKDSPKVKIAKLAEKAAAQELHVTQAKQNPTVAFSLSATQGNASDSLSASISLSSPLYFTDSSAANARKKVALHSQSIIGLRESVSAAKVEARSAFRDYTGVKITLSAVMAEVEASRLVSEGRLSETKYGLKTTLDLLDAEKSFYDAELRLVKAGHDKTLSEFELLAAVGNLTAIKLGLGNILEDLTQSPRPKNPLNSTVSIWK